MLLQALNLRHSYGVRELLHDVTLEIHQGDRIGLVGRNGEGKSTLMRLLAQVEQPESGEVLTNTSVAYVPQALDMQPGQSVSDWLLAHEVSLEGSLAKELRLQGHIWELPVDSLSGGEQTKLALLRALSQCPELLLLDEPTNHLDMETVQWLEQWLPSSGISLLVISHDRHFLDAVTTGTWELAQCEVTCFPGSYQHYAAWKVQEEERICRQYEDYLHKKDQLEAAILRKKQWAEKGNKGRKATDTFARNLSGIDQARAAGANAAAKAMKRRLEHLKPEEKPEQRLTANVQFLEIETAARSVLIRGEQLTFGYDDRPILSNVDFEVNREDRIALIGPNGAGKTTLLKLFSRLLLPRSGSLRITPTATIGYFDQLFSTLDPQQTLLQDLLSLPKIDATTARLFLGSFLFKGDDVFRPLRSLSYGEQVRFVFVKLILSRTNTLILDEPSNHLDIETRERLEAALSDYPGAIVCASHDRYFLEKMTNKVWEIRDGQLQIHPYGYREYRKRMEGDQQAAQTLSKSQRRQAAQDRLLVIETRIAWLSAELGIITDEAKKRELDREFLDLSRQARELRQEVHSS